MPDEGTFNPVPAAHRRLATSVPPGNDPRRTEHEEGMSRACPAIRREFGPKSMRRIRVTNLLWPKASARGIFLWGDESGRYIFYGPKRQRGESFRQHKIRLPRHLHRSARSVPCTRVMNLHWPGVSARGRLYEPTLSRPDCFSEWHEPERAQAK